jgi:hypothetical protein
MCKKDVLCDGLCVRKMSQRQRGGERGSFWFRERKTFKNLGER